MDDAVVSADALRAKLAYRRCANFDCDGAHIMLVELTAADASVLWSELEKAENSGQSIDAYTRLVWKGAHDPAGNRLYDNLDDVRELPIRLIVPMAESIMELSELGLDQKKAQEDGSLPID